jgi:UDP-glucose 4-epimerase
MPMSESFSPRRVLVTGGAGFIGSHVADRYLAEGCEVTVLDDLSNGKRDRVPEAAEFVQLELNSHEVDSVFERGGFDLVNHHAAQMDVRVSVAHPALDARTNVLGLLNVLECARRHGTRRVVYISSGGVVYGEPTVIPTPEDHPLRPLSPYGVTKLVGEQYLHYYACVHGMDYAALRYSNVYGPRQEPGGEAGVIAIFAAQILKEESITLFGDGKQERDYVHVADVVEANWRASTRSLPAPDTIVARAWNIGTGRGTSVGELADVLMAGAGCEVERVFAAARAGELARSVLDIAKAEQELEWRPAVPLKDGLEQTMRYIERRINSQRVADSP